MKILKEEIREIADGRWLNAKTGRYYKTAIGAQRALKRAIKDMPKPVMQIIDWHPITVIGKYTIKAITNQNLK